MQRLARTPLTAENQKAITLYQEFKNVKNLLARYLPPSNLTLFAEPVVQNNMVEWYTSLVGQPVLSDENNSNVRSRIDATLLAIQKLLGQLQVNQEISQNQTALIQAMLDSLYCSQKQIYTLNQEPVIVGWGLEERKAPPPPPVSHATTTTTTTTTRKHGWCCWLLPLLLLLLAILLFWWFYMKPLPVIEEPMKKPSQEEQQLPVAQLESPKSEPEPVLNPTPVEELKKEESVAVVEEPKPMEDIKSEEVKPTEEVEVPKEIKASALQCTKNIKPEERPQMVIVFDNSISMLYSLLENEATINRFEYRYSMGMTYADEINYMRREPNRLSVAKKSASSILDKIDPNIDVGFVALNYCPNATNSGFYAPKKRAALKKKIRSMYPNLNHPIGGTPLYSGLKQAASMVDGVKRDAFILLISDGIDTCQQGDVCQLAQSLARAKPKLKINVVDIGNAKAANCAARVTGGKVFTANNPSQVTKMINQAIKPMEVEEECK